MNDHPVRVARKAKGLSVAELARLAGVSVPTVYAIEQGRNVGRVSTLASLATVLELPLTDLVRILP